VGADRRGPLAAFIILAVIAVILLVTSVRSQASSGWFRTTVVAGPVTEPSPWGPRDVTQVVRDGVVLVRKAADPSGPEDSAAETVGASPSVVAKPAARATSSAPHQVAETSRHDHPTSTPPQPVGDPADDDATERPGGTAAPVEARPTSSAASDHGRHLGWYKSHGHDVSADDAGVDTDNADTDSPDTDSGDVDTERSGHGNGHACGHDRSRGWLPGFGVRSHGGRH
jgi:hypothetical protein